MNKRFSPTFWRKLEKINTVKEDPKKQLILDLLVQKNIFILIKIFLLKGRIILLF